MIDPTQIEVLRNRLEEIGDGMAVTLARSSRSTIVRAAMDFSTGVLGPSGELIAQGLCQAIHLGGMQPALQACLEYFDGRVYPGDIFINNDPYEGGSHLPDLFLYKPIFHNGVCIAYLCAMTHYPDMGGRVAGSCACDSTEIYQEGLRIPPLKLAEEGVLNDTLLRILEKAVRVPDLVMGDLQGNLSALRYGEGEFGRLLSQYGIEGFHMQVDNLLVYTEQMTRAAISALPNGRWEFTDYISDDAIDIKPIKIATSMTVQEDEMTLDFAGTDPQAKGAINPPLATSKAMAYAAVKSALGALGNDIPNTGGYFRPVHFEAPVGCFVNPLPPAPVVARNVGGTRIFQAVMGAFAEMLPETFPASTGGCELQLTWAGYDKSKTPWKPWIMGEGANEMAGGAFPYKDGFDTQGCGTTNLANVPVEQIEIEHPVRVEEYGILADMEGAGMYRGGGGMVRTFRVIAEEAVFQVRSDRRSHPPYGLQGGQSAGKSAVVLNPNTPDEALLATKFVEDFKKGDILCLRMPGGGGWGDPLKRDPEMVLQDVMEERITLGRAETVYGVVINGATCEIDWGATKHLRTS